MVAGVELLDPDVFVLNVEEPEVFDVATEELETAEVFDVAGVELETIEIFEVFGVELDADEVFDVARVELETILLDVTGEELELAVFVVIGVLLEEPIVE